MPKVSVIVPVYNVEKYLSRCVESLICQSLSEIEIILVDDASPDRCPSLCDDYARKDKRIKVIHKHNEGLGFARNSGLDIASGEFIAFVDSDDFVDTEMYEKLYDYALQYKCDSVFCGFKTEEPDGSWVASNEVNKDQIFSGHEIYSFMLNMIASGCKVKKERLYQMSVWHAIYKHSLIKSNNIRFLCERSVVSEDIPFQIDFLKKVDRIAYVNEIFYSYCYNKNSLTQNFKSEKFEGFKQLRRILIDKDENFEYRNRVNRLFIGYVRSFCFSACNLNRLERIKILNKVQNDEIWADIKSEFNASYLPIYAQCIYMMTLFRNEYLLDVILQIAKKFRRAQNKC